MEWLSNASEVVTTGIQLGIFAAIVLVIVYLLPHGVKYLKEKANSIELFKKTQFDEAAIEAVAMAVSNWGQKYIKTLKEQKQAGVSLTDEEKKTARDGALSQAAEVLKSKGIDLFKEYSPDALDAMVRYTVDKLDAKTGPEPVKEVTVPIG